MSKHSIALLAGALAIAIIATGCGSSDNNNNSSSSATAGTSSLTKAEFIKQADAICAKDHKQIETEFQAKKEGIGDITKSKDALAEVIETIVLPVREQEAEELRALGAPSGDEAEVEAIVAALQEGVEKGEEDPAAALSTSTGTFVKASKLAGEYGLKICGQA